MGRPLINIVGQKFGRLTVKSHLGRKHHTSMWRCKCDCGNVVDVQGGAIKNGSIKSCGCWQSDRMAKLNLKHGFARNGVKVPEYKTWEGMRRRCENSADKSFPHYGGKGISVCDRWKDFQVFLSDIEPRPSPRHSLDRIDVNGNYEPSNCRWATASQQCRNKTTNRFIVFNGKPMTLVKASEKSGIPYKTLKSRLQKGWTDDRAINTPVSQAKVNAQRNIRAT